MLGLTGDVVGARSAEQQNKLRIAVPSVIERQHFGCEIRSPSYGRYRRDSCETKETRQNEATNRPISRGKSRKAETGAPPARE